MSMATKCQGVEERILRHDDLQEGKESKEMSTQQSVGQTQNTEDLELKSNEAYTVFQITTVDKEAYSR